MKYFCHICNQFHDDDEPCSSIIANSNKNELIPDRYFVPKVAPDIFNKPSFDPVIFPKPEPNYFDKPKFEADLFPKLDPPIFDKPKFEADLFPKLDPLNFDKPKFEADLFPKLDPLNFDKPKFEADIFPKLDPPIFDKPKFEADLFPKLDPPIFETPKFEPELFPKIEPLMPPPAPVFDLNHNTLGWKPAFDDHIYTGIGGNGPGLTIGPGGMVRDQMDHLIGQMGPMNTLYPPDLPQMPDYGPPQSDPGSWAPG